MNELDAQNPTVLSGLALSPTERNVLVHVRNGEGLSRADLGKELGLAKATLSKAVGKFVESGLVTEQRETPVPGRVGQPKLRLTLRPNSVLLVGLNLSTRGCYSAVCDFRGVPIWTSEPMTIDPGRPDTAFAVAHDLLSAAIVQAHPRVEVGFFVPGLIGNDGHIQEITPLQRGIPFATIIDRLRRDFPANQIHIGQADVVFQALRPDNFGKVIVHVGLADGVGGQIFDRDRLFRGGFSQAGNIGALVPSSGPRPSVADLAGYLDVDVDALTLDGLETLHRNLDPRLMAWLDSRAPRLSMPLSTVVQLINPNKIVIGGNFPISILNEIVTRIDLTVFDTHGRMPLTKPKIVVADIIGERARAIAAAALPLAQFLQTVS